MNVSASSQVNLADAITVMNSSFNAWSTASCGDGTPSIQVSHLGTTTSTEIGFNKGVSSAGADASGNGEVKNENIVLFQDKTWPHDDGDDALALTTFTYEKNTGEVFDADIEINSASAKLVLTGKPPSGRYELRSIFTHEAGHFLGLAHTASIGATMFPRYDPGTEGLGTLEADDVAGICSVYLRDFTRVTGTDLATRTAASATCAPADYIAPSSTVRTTGCSCDSSPSTYSNAAISLGAVCCASLLLRRRRRKPICS